MSRVNNGVLTFGEFAETLGETNVDDFIDEDVTLETRSLFGKKLLVISQQVLPGAALDDVRGRRFQEEHGTLIAQLDAISLNQESLQVLNLFSEATLAELKRIFHYEESQPDKDNSYAALTAYITRFDPPVGATFLRKRRDFCKKLIEGAYFLSHKPDGELQTDLAFYHTVFHAQMVAEACIGGAISSVESLSFSPSSWWGQFVGELILKYKDKIREGIETHIGPFFGSITGIKTLDEHFKDPGYNMAMRDLEEAIAPILLSDAQVLIPTISQQYYDLVGQAENNTIKEIAIRNLVQQGLETEQTEEEIRKKIQDKDQELLRKLDAEISLIQRILAKENKEEEKIFQNYNQDRQQQIASAVEKVFDILQENPKSNLGLQEICPTTYKELYIALKALAKREISAKAPQAAVISDEEIAAYIASTEFRNNQQAVRLVQQNREIIRHAARLAEQNVQTHYNISAQKFAEIKKDFEEKEELETQLRQVRGELLTNYLQNSDNPILKLFANCNHYEFLEIEGQANRQAALSDHVIEMMMQENSDPNKPPYVEIKEIDKENFALVLKAVAYKVKGKQIPLWLQEEITAKARQTSPQAEGNGALVYLAENVITNESAKFLIQDACNAYAQLQPGASIQDLITNGASFVTIRDFLDNHPRAIREFVLQGHKLNLSGLLFHPAQNEIIALLLSKTSSILLSRRMNANGLFDFKSCLKSAIDEKETEFLHNYMMMHKTYDHSFLRPYYEVRLEDFGDNIEEAAQVLAKAVKLYSGYTHVAEDVKANILYSLLRKIELGDARLVNYILVHDLYEGGTAKFFQDIFPHLNNIHARKLLLSFDITDNNFFQNKEAIEAYLQAVRQLFPPQERSTIFTSPNFIFAIKNLANINQENFLYLFRRLDNTQKKRVILVRDVHHQNILDTNVIFHLANNKKIFEEFINEVLNLSRSEEDKIAAFIAVNKKYLIENPRIFNKFSSENKRAIILSGNPQSSFNAKLFGEIASKNSDYFEEFFLQSINAVEEEEKQQIIKILLTQKECLHYLFSHPDFFDKLSDQYKKLIVFYGGGINFQLFKSMAILNNDTFEHLFLATLSLISLEPEQEKRAQQYRFLYIFFDDENCKRYLCKHPALLQKVLTYFSVDERKTLLLRPTILNAEIVGAAPIKTILESLDDKARKSVLFMKDLRKKPVWAFFYPDHAGQFNPQQTIALFADLLRPDDYPLTLKILLGVSNEPLDFRNLEAQMALRCACENPQYLDEILKNLNSSKHNLTVPIEHGRSQSMLQWVFGLGNDYNMLQVINLLEAAKKYPEIREELITNQNSNGETVLFCLQKTLDMKNFFDALTDEEVERVVKISNKYHRSILDSAILEYRASISFRKEEEIEHLPSFDVNGVRAKSFFAPLVIAMIPRHQRLFTRMIGRLSDSDRKLMDFVMNSEEIKEVITQYSDVPSSSPSLVSSRFSVPALASLSQGRGN